MTTPKYPIGTFVQKKGRAKWRGKVKGHYQTDLTKEGVVIESWYEGGSVQIYPDTAIIPWTPPTAHDSADRAIEDLLHRVDLLETTLQEARISIVMNCPVVLFSEDTNETVWDVITDVLGDYDTASVEAGLK